MHRIATLLKKQSLRQHILKTPLLVFDTSSKKMEDGKQLLRRRYPFHSCARGNVSFKAQGSMQKPIRKSTFPMEKAHIWMQNPHGLPYLCSVHELSPHRISQVSLSLLNWCIWSLPGRFWKTGWKTQVGGRDLWILSPPIMWDDILNAFPGKDLQD